MLTKRHIATIALASLAWGAFATMVGTPADLSEAAVPQVDVASGKLIATQQMRKERPLVAASTDPLGPVVFDESAATDGTDIQGEPTSGTDVGDPPPEVLMQPAGSRSGSQASTLSADLSLRIASLPTLAVGERGELEIILGNEGPSDAGSAAITYVLPQGLVLATAGPNGCRAADGLVTCAFDGPLPAGETAIVTIPVELVALPEHGEPLTDEIVSIARTSVSDPEPSNDSLSIAPLLAKQVATTTPVTASTPLVTAN